MPDDAIYVGRPSRWGNWYVVRQYADLYAGNFHGKYEPPDAFVVQATDKWGHRTGSQWAGFADKTEARAFAVDLYRRSLEATYLDVDGPLNRKWYLKGLEGHDLACWCALDSPCHADVLLELANGVLETLSPVGG